MAWGVDEVRVVDVVADDITEDRTLCGVESAPPV